MAAGSALYLVPELHPLALLGIGSALGLAGLQELNFGSNVKGLTRGRKIMTLSEKQQLFTVMVANLIHWAEEHGYRLTFGEAYRTPEQAALNAKKGSGITNSLHTQRLAGF